MPKFRVIGSVSVGEGVDPINFGDILELPEGTDATWLEPVEDDKPKPKKRTAKQKVETAAAVDTVETADA